MARCKIKIRRIENAATRQITFCKRRAGLIKKAHDLSVLCDAEIAVIIFSSKGKLFEFASSSMESIIERYTAYQGDSESPDVPLNASNEHEPDRVMKYTKKLKVQQRNLMGDDLERLSLKDLIQLEQQVGQRLGQIRARKSQLFIENLEELNEKVIDASKMTKESSKLLQGHFSKSTGFGYSFCNDDSLQPSYQELRLENDTPLRLWVDVESCGQSYQTSVPKRSIITEDLNRSPNWID